MVFVLSQIWRLLKYELLQHQLYVFKNILIKTVKGDYQPKVNQRRCSL